MPTPTRILILGGGFGGVYTALHLQRLFKRDPAVQVTLVDRDNFFLMTPLLFEAGSGVLEPRHAVTPIRTLFRKARFIEADVEQVDLAARTVHARHSPTGRAYALPYDHLVLALGGVTNTKVVPGAEHAFTFKTLADAIFLRNHIIDLFEQADVETDPTRKATLLSFVIIGAGLVGVELTGELTEFVHNLTRTYRNINYDQVKFHVLENGPKVLPEMERPLADYAAKILQKRGVDLRTNTPAQRIEPGRVHLPPSAIRDPQSAIPQHSELDTQHSFIDAATILLVAGVTPNPALAPLPIDKDKRGRAIVAPTMRSNQRPELWAVGDCAHIPDPDGHPYPSLAQHALREAKVLAHNIASAIRTPDAPLKPFDYKTMGMLASLGRNKGVGRVMKLRIYGFAAWWVWRTYYLMQMPRWSRRIRIVLDWTIALFFKNDVVKLDLFGHRHPTMTMPAPPPPQTTVPRDPPTPGSEPQATTRMETQNAR